MCICCQEVVFEPITTKCLHNSCKVSSPSVLCSCTLLNRQLLLSLKALSKMEVLTMTCTLAHKYTFKPAFLHHRVAWLGPSKQVCSLAQFVDKISVTS